MIYYQYPPYYTPNTRYVPPSPWKKPATPKQPLPHPQNIKKSNDNIMFELFGISLYFDDVLLICLIFFLYNEGVKDKYLFIALILLLLS